MFLRSSLKNAAHVKHTEQQKELGTDEVEPDVKKLEDMLQGSQAKEVIFRLK